jgi:hypothetical protein
MPLLNRFGLYSDSWHVTVISDVKLTVHRMSVHDMVVHDVGMHDIVVHDVAVQYMAVHDVGIPGMCVTGVDVHKMRTFFNGKKLIFDTHFREKKR